MTVVGHHTIHVDLTVHNAIMLIKFSKQLANSSAKIMATKVNSKPCQTYEMEPFPRSRYWLYRRTQNLANI